MKRILFALICLCSLYAQEPPEIRGITIIDAQNDLTKVKRKPGISFRVTGANGRGICSKLDLYLGRRMDYQTLKDIKNAVIDFIYAQDLFAVVIVSEQEVTDGVVIIEILKTKVGDIAFTGQNWFSESVIASAVSLKPGDNLNQNKALNDLGFLNRNPSHQTTLYLSPGDEPGTTDLEFVTQDQFPAHFYLGGDSTGVRVADRIRYFIGGKWDNAFQRGDTLSFQYTTSPGFKRYQSYAATYGANLSSKNVLKFLGIYGSIDADIPDFVSTGKTAMFSIVHSRLIEPMYRHFKPQFDVGLVYKYFNSNLVAIGTISEVPLVLQSANIFEIQLGYTATHFWDSHQITLQLNGYVSPFTGLIPHHNDTVYQILRPGSFVRFAYMNGTFAYRYGLNQRWGCLLTLNGQAATGPLLVTEQISLGGMTTVRGYEEAQFLADNGYYGQLEFYLPYYQFMPKKWKLEDKAYFVAFFDAGFGRNDEGTETGETKQALYGTGPGFRYELDNYFLFRAEYGFQLRHVPGGDSLGRFYLSAMVSY